MDTNKTNAERDEAAAFIETSRTEQFNGQDVVIKPLDVGKIIRISGDLKTAVPALFALADDKAGVSDAEQLSEVFNVLHAHGEAVLRVLSIATDVPLALLSTTSDIIGLWKLARAVYQQNTSFFGPQIAHLLGDLQQQVGGLAALLAGAGAMPSTPSSAPATA